MKLSKSQQKLLKQAEERFVSYFTDESQEADSLDGAVDSFREYLIERGLLNEEE